MSNVDFRLSAVLQRLDGETYLEEVLLFPEVCCLGADPARLHRAVKNLLTRLVLDVAPGELSRRRVPAGAEAGHVEVVLKPGVRSTAWEEPVTLRLPVVRWSHLGRESEKETVEKYVAFVPALGIEVCAAKPESLETMLVNHVRTALMRSKANASLERLIWLTRCKDAEIVPLEMSVECKSPKQLAREELDERARPKSVLPEVGVDLTKEWLRPGYELDVLLARLVETLTGSEPRSVLLVGPSGVGKTAAVHEMVRRRRDFGFGRTPFWGTSGARLVAGMSGFGMWQERAANLWREASHERAILHLGNLLELMEVGKSEHQTQGIASFLRPYLARGDLLTIAECTPEQLPLIERREPHLLSVFAQIPVAEPTREQGTRILARYAEAFGSDKATIGADGLDKLDLLHRRYATYSAYPGRPLRFLQNLLTDRAAHALGSLTAGDVTHAFARETGLPLWLLDEAERLDLPWARGWFAERVIGQAEAVDLVVDLLTTVKAGLTRPRKPIASLLFIGPTGVGKTEMAKALAEFLFGARDRLTRFDMSEYADPGAVTRLVGGSFQGEGHLTARVREQPFSVVLLDEIEKAHPLLFDLLLQVLGEGRLTDAAGRLADFSNAVVIMTSNLGAESFRQGTLGIVAPGQTAERARAHFVQAVQDFFRPELFNRIDRIVPFAPLDEATILSIAHRQLDLVRARDGVRYRGVALTWTPDVAALLARRGFDARYGARPLKRAIDRELLAPLADKLNGYVVDTPLAAQVSAKNDELAARVKAVSGANEAPARAEAATVGACMNLRRAVQRLQRSPAALEMDNEIHRLQLVEKRLHHGMAVGLDDARRLSRLAGWREIRRGLDDLFAEVCGLEDDGLLRLVTIGPAAEESAVNLQERLESASTDWRRWLLALYLQRFERPDDVVIAIFGENPALMMLLADAYAHIAEQTGGQAEVWQFLPSRKGRAADKPSPLERRLVTDAKSLWRRANNVPMRGWDADKKAFKAEERVAKPLDGVIGLGLVIHAPAALPRFMGETGKHDFRTAQARGMCLVEASELAWHDYEPPEGVERKGSIATLVRRRSYDLVAGVIEDERLTGKLAGNIDNLPLALGQALERCLTRNLEGMLQE